MIALQKVDEIATEVARRYLGKDNVVRVNSQPWPDSRGDDALRVEIILVPDAPPKLKGKALLGMLLGMRRELEQSGEDRIPIVEYATTDEIEDGDDP